MSRSQRAWGELGEALPRGDPHGVSVHLPTWEATMGWATRDPKFVAKMKTGYPRFYFHRIVVDLIDRVRCLIEEAGLSRFPSAVAGADHAAMISPCMRSAYDLIAYLERHGSNLLPPPNTELYFLSLGESSESSQVRSIRTRPVQWHNFELAVVVFPASKELTTLAKQFWMHTGTGISSRYAEICIRALPFLGIRQLPTSLADLQLNHVSAFMGKIEATLTNENSVAQNVKGVQNPRAKGREEEIGLAREHLQLEGDNRIKCVLRDRLARLNTSKSLAISEEHVTLYPTGMSAITAAAAALKQTTSERTAPVVVFGFLYVDTFKTIERVQDWPTILHGQASASELDELAAYLASGRRILGLFLEVPGNPLLRTPDLLRLRGLANKHHFPIIIDDTVGTPVNVDVMRFADIIATSLTKMFSGACNVMGGALILNPSLPFFAQFKTALQAEFIDTYFPGDAAVMCTNSADFAQRVRIASANAEVIADLLRGSSLVSRVYYPKGDDTQELYHAIRRPHGGYGFLLSCEFANPAVAVAFFDALETAKGPSLGTNFTLTAPYTLYAHWGEQEWAASYGVREFLVRMSVGLEPVDELRKTVEKALQVAEEAASTDESR